MTPDLRPLCLPDLCYSIGVVLPSPDTINVEGGASYLRFVCLDEVGKRAFVGFGLRQSYVAFTVQITDTCLPDMSLGGQDTF